VLTLLQIAALVGVVAVCVAVCVLFLQVRYELQDAGKLPKGEICHLDLKLLCPMPSWPRKP
jgi:hypothetical protein